MPDSGPLKLAYTGQLGRGFSAPLEEALELKLEPDLDLAI
jgi:hypothetical protein